MSTEEKQLKIAEVPFFILQTYFTTSACRLDASETPPKNLTDEGRTDDYIFLNPESNNFQTISMYPMSGATSSSSISGIIVENWSEIGHRLDASIRLERWNGWWQTSATSAEHDSMVFIKKGSKIYQWIKSNYPSYVNLNKDMWYIGRVEEHSSLWVRIKYYGFRDEIRTVIPEYNMKERFMVFLNTFFDKIQTKIRKKESELVLFKDFEELDPLYLDRTGRMLIDELFDTDTSFYLHDNAKALFLRELSSILKKKGTYVPLYFLWEILSWSRSNTVAIREMYYNEGDYQEWRRSYYEYMDIEDEIERGNAATDTLSLYDSLLEDNTDMDEKSSWYAEPELVSDSRIYPSSASSHIRIDDGLWKSDSRLPGLIATDRIRKVPIYTINMSLDEDKIWGIPKEYQNVCLNPSFETSGTSLNTAKYWSGGILSAAGGRTGSNSITLALAISGTTTIIGTQINLNDYLDKYKAFFPELVIDTYLPDGIYLGGYAKGSLGASGTDGVCYLQADIIFTDGSSTSITTEHYPYGSLSAWTPRDVVYTTTGARIKYVTPKIVFTHVSGSIWFDDIQLVPVYTSASILNDVVGNSIVQLFNKFKPAKFKSYYILNKSLSADINWRPIRDENIKTCYSMGQTISGSDDEYNKLLNLQPVKQFDFDSIQYIIDSITAASAVGAVADPMIYIENQIRNAGFDRQNEEWTVSGFGTDCTSSGIMSGGETRRSTQYSFLISGSSSACSGSLQADRGRPLNDAEKGNNFTAYTSAVWNHPVQFPIPTKKAIIGFWVWTSGSGTNRWISEDPIRISTYLKYTDKTSATVVETITGADIMSNLSSATSGVWNLVYSVCDFSKFVEEVYNMKISVSTPYNGNSTTYIDDIFWVPLYNSFCALQPLRKGPSWNLVPNPYFRYSMQDSEYAQPQRWTTTPAIGTSSSCLLEFGQPAFVLTSATSGYTHFDSAVPQAVYNYNGFFKDAVTYDASGDISVGNTYHCWICIPNIYVPKNATINSAILEFVNVNNGSGSTDSVIHIHCNANPYYHLPLDNASAVNMPLTTSYAVWDKTNGFTTWSAGQTTSSCDVTAPFQELSQKADFKAGMPVTFIFKHQSGDVQNSIANDHFSIRLHIDYSLPEGMKIRTYTPIVNGDDGYYRLNGSTFSNTSNGLRLGKYSGGNAFSSFIRFPDVQIEPGEEIFEAYIFFQLYVVQWATGNPITSRIYFNASDNAVAPTNYADCQSITGGLTSNYAVWDGTGDVGVGLVGNKFVVGGNQVTGEKILRTPDIKTPLQEVINRPGWTKGNAVQVILDHHQGYAGNESWLMYSVVPYISYPYRQIPPTLVVITSAAATESIDPSLKFTSTTQSETRYVESNEIDIKKMFGENPIRKIWFGSELKTSSWQTSAGTSAFDMRVHVTYTDASDDYFRLAFPSTGTSTWTPYESTSGGSKDIWKFNVEYRFHNSSGTAYLRNPFVVPVLSAETPIFFCSKNLRNQVLSSGQRMYHFPQDDDNSATIQFDYKEDYNYGIALAKNQPRNEEREIYNPIEYYQPMPSEYGYVTNVLNFADLTSNYYSVVPSGTTTNKFFERDITDKVQGTTADLMLKMEDISSSDLKWVGFRYGSFSFTSGVSGTPVSHLYLNGWCTSSNRYIQMSDVFISGGSMYHKTSGGYLTIGSSADYLFFKDKFVDINYYRLFSMDGHISYEDYALFLIDTLPDDLEEAMHNRLYNKIKWAVFGKGGLDSISSPPIRSVPTILATSALPLPLSSSVPSALSALDGLYGDLWEINDTDDVPSGTDPSEASALYQEMYQTRAVEILSAYGNMRQRHKTIVTPVFEKKWIKGSDSEDQRVLVKVRLDSEDAEWFNELWLLNQDKTKVLFYSRFPKIYVPKDIKLIFNIVIVPYITS